MKRKVLSLIMTVVFLFGTVSIPALADITAEISSGSTITYQNVLDETNTAVINFNVNEAGNYRIKFKGGVQHDYNMDMTYLAELTDSTDAVQSLLASAPWTGKSEGDAGYNTKADSILGCLTLSQGENTLTLTHLGGGSSKGFTLTFEKVGDANPENTYTIIKSFGDDNVNDVYYSGTKDGLLRYNSYVTWETDIEYDGDYDVYFYGSVESSSVYNNGNAQIDVTPVSGTASTVSNRINWTGIKSSYNVFNQKFSSGASMNTRLLNRLGKLKGLTKGKNTIKFTNTKSGGGVPHNQATNKIYLVKSSEPNYEVLLKKDDGVGTSLGSSYNQFTNKSSVTWSNITLEHDGEYAIRFYGGVQNNYSVRDLMLKFEATNEIETKSFESSAKYTGNNSANIYGVGMSNSGWGTFYDNVLGNMMLTKGTYTFVISGTDTISQSSHSRFFDVTLDKVGNYEAIKPLEVEDMYSEGNNIVVDFSREIINTADNLRKIEVLADNGTATVTLNTMDLSKAVISGVTGDVWVKVKAAITDNLNTFMEADVEDVFHIATTKTTKKITNASTPISGIVEEETNVQKSNRFSKFWAFGRNEYISYRINIDEPGVYNVSFLGGSGTNTKPGTSKLAVAVNGMTHYRTFSTANNFYDEIDVNIGETVFTEPGAYTVRVTNGGGGTVTAREVTLEKITDLEDEDADYSHSFNVAEYEKLSDGLTVAFTDEFAILNRNDMIRWSFKAPYSGYYDISFGLTGQGEECQLHLNGTKAESVFADGSGLAIWSKVPLVGGQVYTVALENLAINTGDVEVRGVTFERKAAFVDEIVVDKLDIETADGVRIPYSIVDGFDAYAAVTLKEYGTAEGEIQLIIAQYESEEKLVGAQTIVIDPAEIKSGEEKKYTVKLTFEGNGGLVKAFILEKKNLVPLTRSVTYIHSDNFSESDFLETVAYENALDVISKYDGYDVSLYTTYEDDISVVEPIFYESPVITGQTKAFAYLGIPKSATEDAPVPAVVLIHGAGGNANLKWVQEWNKRGFAAIAVSMYGTGLEKDDSFINGNKPHPFAGILPWGDLGEGFRINKEECGMYQNAINVYNANTLLRSLPEINSDKIGIVGLSMGAVTTTFSMGVDGRFCFAVPVYGGGYLDYSRTYMKNSTYQGGIGTSLLWDPANFAARVKMPVLYINNDFDAAFSIDSTSFTASVTPDSYICIRHNYPHDTGWVINTPQVYDFAEKICSGDKSPYARITDAKAENGYLTANIDCTEDDIKRVRLYYITEDEIPKRENVKSNYWIASDNDYKLEGSVLKIAIPEGATHCYATIEHELITSDYAANGIAVSTKVLKVR